MQGIAFAGISAAFIVAVCAGAASAHEVTTKKMLIKDNATPAKRQIQAFSKDPTVLYADADNPGTNGASIHVYSATDDECLLLPGGPQWTDNGKLWKYKNKETKNQVQIGNGKLQVKIRSGVDFTLADDFPQETVNVVVKLGPMGDDLCMRCTVATKDDEKQFLAKDCAATACDVDLTPCEPVATTTTSTTTTSTTLPPLPGTVLKAVLSQTNGVFTYAMTLGVAGADMACNTAFPGSHACAASELLAAEAAGDLDNITDLDDDVVTSFWAIDPLRPDTEQCISTLMGGGTRWNYLTAHIDSKGDVFDLNNATGDLSALDENNSCGQSHWVGCCQ